MRVLVVGSGGREHALAWRLARSPTVTEIFSAPGNSGTATVGTNLPVADTDIDGLVRIAADRSIDLVVVGPEIPLALGLSDRLAAAGIPCFGPSRAAARLESSKSFARDVHGRGREWQARSTGYSTVHQRPWLTPSTGTVPW